MHPTCMSSLGTSSYVLESVEVLLEDVAHLGSEKNEICVRSKHHCFGHWPRFDLVQISLHPPSVSHSQEGMPRSVADVSNGFHVNVVIVQWLRICRGPCLCQEDAEPPSKSLRAASLRRDRINQLWNLENVIISISIYFFGHLWAAEQPLNTMDQY